MFKRALQAKHWMAIGLDKWNEMENEDIPATRVRKMRLVEKKSRANPDEEFEASESASSDSELEEVETVVEPEASEKSSSDTELSEDVGSFVFCEVCPGRKFLTGKDIEDHMKSKQHLKKLASSQPMQSQPPKDDTVSGKRPRKEKPVSEKQVPSASNRKARRAAKQDTRPIE